LRDYITFNLNIQVFLSIFDIDVKNTIFHWL